MRREVKLENQVSMLLPRNPADHDPMLPLQEAWVRLLAGDEFGTHMLQGTANG